MSGSENRQVCPSSQQLVEIVVQIFNVNWEGSGAQQGGNPERDQ